MAANQEIKECPLCGAKSTHTKINMSQLFIECPSCGRYEFDNSVFNFGQFVSNLYDSNKLASYLYYNGYLKPKIDDQRFFNYIGTKEQFDKVQAEYPWCYHVTPEIVDNWYPKTFSEKVDRYLLGLYERSHYINEILLFSEEQLNSACFALRNAGGPMGSIPELIERQVEFFLNYLVEQQYIEAASCRSVLMPKAYERIDQLQKNSAMNTKNVFIAMSFALDMQPVRDAIKSALLECGYIPRIMDEIEHNHQIVPEMLYEIRESKFVIAELTGHNNGAYFEAGYALGFGKEVIQICQRSKFGDDGHFDVKQINTVLWDDTDDLKRKLVARIQATIA